MATITGTNGNDNLVGTADADTISPMLGADNVDGGGGSDTLIVDYSSAPIDPFAGASQANFMSVVTSVGGSFAGYVRTIDAGNSVNFSNIEHLQVKLDAWHNTFIIDGAALAFGATLTLDGGAGTDTLDADLSTLAAVTFNAGAGGTTASFGTFVNVEAFKLNLTAAADMVTGGSGNDTFNGNGGDDVLNGGGGNDVISGGSGSNSLGGGDGDDRIVSTGIDTVDGGAHNFDGDRWVGDYGSSTDNLTFTRDRAAGTGSLSNGTTLTGIERIEALTTGSGNDVITFTGTSESFNVSTGAGEDSLSFTGNAFQGSISADGAGAFKGLVANNLFSGVEHLAFVDSGGSELITVDAAPLLGGATLSLNAGGGTDTLAIDFSALGAIGFAVGAGGTVTTNVAAMLSGFENFQIDTGAGADTIATSNGDDLVRTAGGNDVISTAGGNDLLDGGAGADSMTGGAGNDTYYVDELGDSVAENAAEGTDEIRTGLASFSLAGLANFENLSGRSAAGQTLTGNASSNAITGGSGNDVIDGGLGADTMRGEAGNDLYFVDDIGDTIIEFHQGDYDEVRTGIAVYSLDISANVEKLVGTSDTGQSLTGSYASNLIVGGAGDDILDYGGGGTDTLAGGLGDDVYIVTYNTTIVELDGEGVDEVRTHSSFSIAAMDNVENLTGLSTFWNQQLTGNALANVITAGGGWDTLDGGAGNDSLFGGAGGDTLQGGTGDDLLDGGADWDSMIGGSGNDVYFVDIANENVAELQGGGTDEIRTALATFSIAELSELENLTGLGSGNQSLTGNGAANVIDGGLGADSMAGGLGDDVYLVDNAGDTVIEAAGEGTDEVRTGLAAYTLGAEVEKLTGTGQSQTLTGNDLANVIAGASGGDTLVGGGGNDTLNGGDGDDMLDGGAGNDVVNGGNGDDTAFVTGGTTSADTGTDVVNLGFVVRDAADPRGTDHLIIDYGAMTQNVTFGDFSPSHGVTGAQDTIQVGGVDRLTFYGIGRLTMTTGSGNDILYAVSKTDTLSAGAGDDVIYDFYTSDGGITRIDGGAGMDRAVSVNWSDLQQAVLLDMNDPTGVTIGAGSSERYLRGVEAVEYLATGWGNDVIRLHSATTLRNVVHTNYGNDTVTVYGGATRLTTGLVTVDLGGPLDMDHLIVDFSAAIEQIVYQAYDINSVALIGGVQMHQYSGFERLTFTTGSANDTVDGRASAFAAHIFATGAGDDLLYGGGAADILDGGLGADAMAGGGGHDTYVVDNEGDIVTELAGAGTDEIRTDLASYSLTSAANVENLTGGAGDQVLGGNNGDNRIDGGAGADAMSGGLGNDVYIVDNAGDTVTELDGEGIDEIRTNLGSKAPPDRLVYVLPDFIENLTGTSAGAQGVRDNALDNVITMGNGHDLVVADAGGVDTINGGGGNDFIYHGDKLTAADVTNGGSGTDTIGLLGDYGSGLVFTATNLIGVERMALYTSLYLPGTGPNNYNITMNDANVASGTEFFVTAASLQSNESLTFNGSSEVGGRFTVHGGAGADTIIGGTSSDFFIGNAGNDTLYGLGGADFLTGGLGADQLRGGGGADFFRYLSTSHSTTGNVDQILDFQHVDRIDLSAIDADGNGGNGNQAFAFIGSGAFTNVAGQIRATNVGNVWTVEGDVNGDGSADLVIQVTVPDATPLVQGDFVL